MIHETPVNQSNASFVHKSEGGPGLGDGRAGGDAQ